MTKTPQSQGGKARAEKLTRERRSEIARKGAQERWARMKGLPRATHGGPNNPLRIGQAEIQCFVLEDGRRVISQRGMNAALQRSEASTRAPSSKAAEGGADKMPPFLRVNTLKPFISSDLAASISSPIEFRHQSGGGVVFGYPAELLPEVCSVWMAARDAGVLSPAQQKFAVAASVIVQALAKVGIVALVDEATGYQEDRERGELYKLLEKYLAAERLAWAKRFPDEFYRQIYRLKNWDWPTGKGRTPLIGHITNDIVYDRLPPGVLEELRRRNPTQDRTKRRKFKHHQFLSEDFGQPDLRDHLLQVIAVMKVSRTWDGFKRNFDEAFPKPGTKIDMALEDE